MLYTDLKRLIEHQKIPDTQVFSLRIPEKVINQFINQKTSCLIRVNASTKYVDQYASNMAKIFGNRATIDAWSYDPSFLDELENLLRTIFQQNNIYIISSSVDIDEDIDTFRLKLLVKQ